MKHHPLILASAIALVLCSCETYDTPDSGAGPKANLSAINSPQVRAAYTGRPAITFPASIAVVRVRGTGSESYNVVSTRELESAHDFDTIARQPGIAGVVSLNRLLLADSTSSVEELRAAAARLHADALIIYTVESDAHDTAVAPPIALVTLGLAPSKTYKVISSASAIVMDVRTGYIYGALEEGATGSGLTSAWASDSATDNTQRKTERAAFEKLTASFGPFWERLYARHRR